MSKPRPSVFPAWAQCACFDSNEEAGEAAERGTIQHGCLERILKNDPKADDLSMLDEHETEGVLWAADYIKEYCKNLQFPIESETKLQYFASEDDWEPLYEGTGDAVCSTNIFDFKSGEPHDYEPQVWAYALCMFQRARKAGTPFVAITCHLLYGRVRSACRFLVYEDQAVNEIKKILARRDDPNRKPVANEYCKWCAHAAICPALNSIALTVAAGREDYKLENYHASEIVKPSEMAKALKLARFLASWCESVEHHAKEMALKGGCILPGFGVSRRAGNRYIKNMPMAYGLSGMSQDDFLKLCRVPIGQLEKAIGKKKFAQDFEPILGRGNESCFLTAEKPPKEISGDAVATPEAATSLSAQPQSALPVSVQPVTAEPDTEW